MKRKIVVVVTLLVSLFVNLKSVDASTFDESKVRKNPENQNMTDIKLNNLIISSEQAIETIDVEFIDSPNKVTANVYAKGTSDLIESFEEQKAPENALRTRAGTSTYNSTVSARYRVGNSKSKIYVVAYANVTISAGTGWAQINKAPSKIWQSPDSSGAWTLKNKNQSVRNVKFPTNNMGLNIQGLVEISKSVSTSMGFSFKVMEGMGFDMSGTSSQTWYARKNYNSTVYIKTMW